MQHLFFYPWEKKAGREAKIYVFFAESYLKIKKTIYKKIKIEYNSIINSAL